MANTTDSPFKFLDAFVREDARFYFGREEEVADLYELTFDTRLLVFFGASGTGKTSLVQCGLANKFPTTQWQELYIRRDEDINASLLRSINSALEEAGGEPAEEPIEALRRLHLQTYTPVYLTFDQFEELFILHPDEAEKAAFFDFLRRFLDASLAAKAILVMREEFIAYLWDWEHRAPSLFDHRYRIVHLERDSIQRIIEKTLRQLEKDGRLRAEAPERIAEEVWEKLSGGKSGASLTNLQIFLDRLYRKAADQNDGQPLLTPALAEGMKDIDNLFNEFLNEELEKLEEQLGPGRKGVPIRLLAAFVSDEQTKNVLEQQSLEGLRKKYKLTEAEMELCLDVFENKLRILKSYVS